MSSAQSRYRTREEISPLFDAQADEYLSDHRIMELYDGIMHQSHDLGRARS